MWIGENARQSSFSLLLLCVVSTTTGTHKGHEAIISILGYDK
jgi:hypothetical protein